MTEQPANLASALAAFQAQIPHVGKGNLAVVKSDKGSYKYTYADLSDISAKVLPLLAKQGLSFSAKPTINADGKFVLEYALRHSSGESDIGQYPLSASGTPQQVGSAITYARRYALCAVTGVTPDEDDDGYAASQAPAIGSGQPPQQRQETARAETQAPAQRRSSQHPADSTGTAQQEAHLVAKAKLRKACADSGWDMHKVADLFAGQHQAELGETTNADLIDAFTASLYSLPDADLKAAVKVAS